MLTDKLIITTYNPYIQLKIEKQVAHKIGERVHILCICERCFGWTFACPKVN